MTIDSNSTIAKSLTTFTLDSNDNLLKNYKYWPQSNKISYAIRVIRFIINRLRRKKRSSNILTNSKSKIKKIPTLFLLPILIAESEK